MNSKTLTIIGVGLGLLWMARRTAANASALVDKTASDRNAALAMHGMSGDHEVMLRRPVGSRLESRIGTVTDTRGLGAFETSDEAGDFSKLGLIRQTQFRSSHGADATSRPQRLIQSTIPSDPARGATTVPWWAQQEILNQSTPADPYALQPVDRVGNAVNPGLRKQASIRNPGIVYASNHGEVDVVAQTQSPDEPGDNSYGETTITDYDDSDAQTYDPNPGGMIGVE